MCVPFIFIFAAKDPPVVQTLLALTLFLHAERSYGGNIWAHIRGVSL